jgi:AcrR family transcriptional regulator
MPIVIDKEKEKRKILDALGECLNDIPLAKVSLRDIAKKAGFSHSKLLVYFGSKEQLLQAFYEDRFDAYYYGAVSWFGSRRLNSYSSVAEFYKDFIRYSVTDGIDKKSTNCMTQIFGLAKYNPDIENLIRISFSRLRYLFEITFKELNIPEEKAASYADAAICFIEGILLCRLLGFSNEDLLRAVDAFCDTMGDTAD